MMNSPWGILAHRKRWLGVCLVACWCVGCAGLRPKSAPKYEIPMQDSVKEQWDFAMELHKRFNDPLHRKDRETNGEKTLAAYRKVVDAWPEATEYVNRSRLASALVTDGLGKRAEALALYEKLRQEVPDDDKVVVNCLFNSAQIYDEQKKYDKAQEYYREIIRDFKEKKDPYFQNFVSRSEMLRNQIHER